MSYLLFQTGLSCAVRALFALGSCLTRSAQEVKQAKEITSAATLAAPFGLALKTSSEYVCRAPRTCTYVLTTRLRDPYGDVAGLLFGPEMEHIYCEECCCVTGDICQAIKYNIYPYAVHTTIYL